MSPQKPFQHVTGSLELRPTSWDLSSKLQIQQYNSIQTLISDLSMIKNWKMIHHVWSMQYCRLWWGQGMLIHTACALCTCFMIRMAHWNEDQKQCISSLHITMQKPPKSTSIGVNTRKYFTSTGSFLNILKFYFYFIWWLNSCNLCITRHLWVGLSPPLIEKCMTDELNQYWATGAFSSDLENLVQIRGLPPSGYDWM